MRIRKRLQSLTSTAPDLSSSPAPRSTAAAAVAVPVGEVAAGGKQGEVAEGGGGEKLHGLGSGSGGSGAAGGGGRGLHPDRDDLLHGCTTKPTSPSPFHPPPPDAAAPPNWGEESSDLAPRGSRFAAGVDVPFDHAARTDGEVPKREQEGENGGGDGDARRRRNSVAYIGAATVAAPKSLGAEAPEPPRGHGGYYKGVAAAAISSAKAEDDMAGWGGEARGFFPLKKRRGCCRARGTRSVCGVAGDGEEEEEEKMPAAAKREVKPRASHTRRRGAPVASSSTTPAIGSTTTAGSYTTARTFALNGISVIGAPTSGGAAKKSDDHVVVKEEVGDVVSSSAAAATVVGGVKKRRSPAVLMEGSRCSRVNGRGWRCCQQTLVGYSLCEHHLGKGRLRSVSSVRCNGPRGRKKEDVDDGAAAAPSSQLQPSPPLQQKQEKQLLMSGVDDDVEEEEKPGKRRRKKIGMVKARSISSLLHQPDYYSTPTAMVAPPAPEPCPSPSPVPNAGAVTAYAAARLHDSDGVTTS